MIRGIYCSNTGLNALQKKTEFIADNLANVGTNGFKQGDISIKTFQNEINGVIADKVSHDFSVGTLQATNNSCDFAIEGEAFFKIMTDQGYKYTKNGSFTIDKEGYLIDRNGNKVAGVNGAIRMVEGKPDQEFLLADFENKEYLTPIEGGFLANEQSEIQAENTHVVQGFVESSNVDMVKSMADMISISRSFALNSRMITSQDEMLKKAVEEVGALK